MDAYNEFLEPSRVSQCIGCNFISPNSKHLIVGKATLLQIFEIYNVNEHGDKAKYRLKLVEQYKLHGHITSLRAIRTADSPNLDYLLVATKTAKFSLIKWDHALHSISTVSLHYYEKSIQNVTYERLKNTDLLLEPGNMCTCLRFKNMLTFLPFETLEDDEDDEELAEDGDIKKSTSKVGHDKIFDSSFMIDAQTLDSSIGDIIDMQFVYNYREPTLAILYLKAHTWSGLLPKVKDNVNFVLLSLDLNSKTSTTVLKVENLPYDIDTLIPLPKPLNGALLLGANEIIHIDNGGILRRIAVNQFTASITASTKNYDDVSHLNLKLEDCSAIPIPHDTKVLLVCSDGLFYFLNFDIDGKSIKKMEIEKIEKSIYSDIYISYPGEIARLDNNLLFVGSKNGPSPLVEFVYDQSEKAISNSKVKENGDNMESNDDYYDDENLYEEEENHEKVLTSKKLVKFVKHDELVNNGPISDFTLGHYSTEKYKAKLLNPNYGEISIISNSGSDSQGSLNIICPSIQPVVKSSLSFSQINRMWTLNNEFLITSDDENSKSEIFQINKSYARLASKSFINDDLTIAMHSLNNGKYILQVTPKNIILYNNKFKKKLSLSDEIDKSDEIIHSTFSLEYLMVFTSSGEVMIFSINTYNLTYSKIAIPKILSDTIITTGHITNSNVLNAVLKDVNLLIKNRGIKRKHLEREVISQEIPNDLKAKQTLFILVAGDNRIVIFSKFHNERCYQLNHVDKFTEHLSLGFFEARDSMPDPFIKQIIFDELGDEDFKEQYLTILTVGGETYLYKLFFDGENFKFLKVKDLLITGAPDNAYPLGTTIERRLVYMSNISGLAGIFVTGLTSYFITRPSKSIPRIFKFGKIPAVSFSPYSDSKIANGLIFLDNKKYARICEIPRDFNYENTMPIKKVHIGETVKSLTYHELSDTYVISSYTQTPYDCRDEENNPIVGTDSSKPSALSYKGSIKLISPFNWSVIDSFELNENEIGMNVKSMALDVGSSTKKFKIKKELIVVGLGKYRMEDLSANGSFKVLEIIDIVPEPGKPETNHKFKEIFHEDTRGAVTSICELSGRFMVAQGQKIIVRDLQDDGAVPVAFLDTSVYVSEAKSFGNILLLGDSLKSVSLAGFDASPFRMIPLGKDSHEIDVNCADFLVKDEEVFILIGDNENVLHLLQYDPEDPSSLGGQRLISKASFRINSTPLCLRCLPKHEDVDDTSFQSIGSTVDGSLFTVFPVSEATYRRMYILQQQLTDKEYHYCGLNPRMNRFSDLSLAGNDTNNKPILDYDLIRLFAKLNEERKKNFANKISGKNSSQEIWKDIMEFEYVLRNL